MTRGERKQGHRQRDGCGPWVLRHEILLDETWGGDWRRFYFQVLYAALRNLDAAASARWV